jgi:hypothetical protein
MSGIKYKKLKSFKDIELAKAKLRYNMLVAETDLHDNLSSLERLISLAGFFNRFAAGYSVAQSTISRVSGIFGKLFRRKSKDEKTASTETHQPEQ